MRGRRPRGPRAGWRQRVGAIAAGGLLSCMLPWLGGCLLLAGRHWEEVRQTEIEPINSALHRHLPRDIKAKDMNAVLAAYATDTGSGLPWNQPVDASLGFTERRVRWVGPPANESIRARYEALFASFDTIERAELRIHRVHWDAREPSGYPADVRLIVRGIGPNGERRTLDQRARVWIDQRQGQWVLTGEEIVARELITSTHPDFEVTTAAAGLDDVHDTTGSPAFHLIGGTFVSSGSAVADFDCDGLEDVALLSASRIRLYHNNGDGTFADVSASVGIPSEIDIAGSGLVFFDADNDGDPDLWVCGVNGQRFYRNQGCRTFVDATDAAGIGPRRWSSMPIVADYDRDGFLDVYVVRMGDHENGAPTPNWDAHNGTGDSLYHNNGDGTFTDVTAAAGIDKKGWNFAGAWGDYNNDGYPDIYVGNEFGSNVLYRNNGDGTFTEVAAAAHALDRGSAMGVAWGDYDNDGNLDIFVSNMYANSRWALFHPEFPPPVPWYFSWVPRADVDAITDELSRGCTLLHNNGDGTFTDVSDAAGIRDAQWGWATEFFDYNNDGRLDVYVANGMVTGPLPDDV